MNLYELSTQYQFLQKELVNDETGEVNENVFAQLNEISASIEEKGVNIVRFIKNLEADCDAIERERKRLQAREKSLNVQIQRLKDYLLFNMQNCEINKISCPEFSISLRQNPESVDVYDEKQVPSRYHRVTVECNKVKIKEDLKIGIEVPGARLTQTTSVIFR